MCGALLFNNKKRRSCHHGYIRKSQNRAWSKSGRFDNSSCGEQQAKQFNQCQRDMPEESLSIREEEVLVEIVNSMTNKEIAQKLNISINTVTTHRRNISSKLQIHTIAGLTIYAISNKLIKVKE